MDASVPELLGEPEAAALAATSTREFARYYSPTSRDGDEEGAPGSFLPTWQIHTSCSS